MEHKEAETMTTELDEKTGQETDSLSGDTEDSKTSDSSTDNETKDETKDEAKKDDSSTSNDTKDSEKPLPYDQDPKWKQARAAEKRLTKVLEKSGFDSTEDLEKALDQGKSLQELIGTRDAKKLVEDADTLKKYQEYWALQDAQKQEDDEESEETITRLKQEAEDLKKELTQDKEATKATEASKKALKTYENEIGKIVETHSLPKDSNEMLKMLLGMDNPLLDVDITDSAAVQRSAKDVATKFLTFTKTLKQQAIDEYAAGKSKIIPISSTTSAKTSTAKKPLPENATTDEVFGQAKNEFLEIILDQANM